VSYEWNPLWHDPEDNANAEYLASIRRMIIASINWLDANPDRNPLWREPDKRALARQAGVPDFVPIGDIAFTGNWEDFFIPRDAAARFWFQSIADACEAKGGKRNAASALMFLKAVSYGMIFKRDGWEAFNKFMLEASREEQGH
jgi:hypothetical protein